MPHETREDRDPQIVHNLLGVLDCGRAGTFNDYCRHLMETAIRRSLTDDAIRRATPGGVVSMESLLAIPLAERQRIHEEVETSMDRRPADPVGILLGNLSMETRRAVEREIEAHPGVAPGVLLELEPECYLAADRDGVREALPLIQEIMRNPSRQASIVARNAEAMARAVGAPLSARVRICTSFIASPAAAVDLEGKIRVALRDVGRVSSLQLQALESRPEPTLAEPISPAHPGR